MVEVDVEKADPSCRPDVKSSSLAAAAVGPAFLILTERESVVTSRAWCQALEAMESSPRVESVMGPLILATATTTCHI